MTEHDIVRHNDMLQALVYEQEKHISVLTNKLGKLHNAAGHLYTIAEDAERVFDDIEKYDLSKIETRQRFALLLTELRRRKAKYRAAIR